MYCKQIAVLLLLLFVHPGWESCSCLSMCAYVRQWGFLTLFFHETHPSWSCFVSHTNSLESIYPCNLRQHCVPDLNLKLLHCLLHYSAFSCYSPQRLLPSRLVTKYNCDSKIDRAAAGNKCTYTCQHTVQHTLTHATWRNSTTPLAYRGHCFISH